MAPEKVESGAEPTPPETLKPSNSRRKLIRRGPSEKKLETVSRKAGEHEGQSAKVVSTSNEDPADVISSTKDLSTNSTLISGEDSNMDENAAAQSPSKSDGAQQQAASSQVAEDLGTEIDPKTTLDEHELKLSKEAADKEAESLKRIDNSNHVHVWPEPVQDNTFALPNLDTTGPEVEEWVRANKKLSMRTVTWNLCARPPPKVDATQVTLLPKNRYHLYVIGSEECERSIAQSAINPSKKSWEAYLTEALGDNYVPIKAHTLQAIHMMIFAHKGIAHLCSTVTSAAVPTGIADTLGNKGGVAISLNFGKTKFAVVNVHLAAHQNAVKRRNTEFKKLNVDLPLVLEKKSRKMSNKREAGHLVSPTVPTPAPTPISGGSEPQAESANAVAAQHHVEAQEDLVPVKNSSTKNPTSSTRTLNDFADRVIFMGDMNYRVRGTRSAVDRLLENNMHDAMIHNDQLIWSMKEQLVPSEYIEPPLNFRPTYKFDLNSDEYDTGSKARIPAWCDRVLYIDRGLKCIAYDSDSSLKTSDHRPVYATFLADVEFEEGEGAITNGEGSPAFSSESQVCTIM